MAEIKLLPRKEFEILLASGEVIAGKYSLWSVKRFADKKGFTLMKLQEYMDKENMTLDDVCEILLCAIEYVCRKKNVPFTFTDIDACEWIEELGGMLGEKYLALTQHASSELEDTVDEKKNLT